MMISFRFGVLCTHIQHWAGWKRISRKSRLCSLRSMLPSRAICRALIRLPTPSETLNFPFPCRKEGSLPIQAKKQKRGRNGPVFACRKSLFDKLIKISELSKVLQSDLNGAGHPSQVHLRAKSRATPGCAPRRPAGQPLAPFLPVFLHFLVYRQPFILYNLLASRKG